MDDTHRFSRKEFRDLIDQVSAQWLRGLSRERLPNSIPLNAVDPRVEPDKQAALNELAWAVSERDLAARCEAADKLPVPIREALETAEDGSTRDAQELKRRTERIEGAWSERDFRADGTSGLNEELTNARRKAKDVAEEVGQIHRALTMLERPSGADAGLQSRIDDARAHAQRVLRSLETVLGRFELLEIDMAQRDMSARREHCEAQLARRRELDEQIRAVEDKLREAPGLLRRLTSPRIVRMQRETLEQRLDHLVRQRDRFDALVAEDDLMHWLDILVDASLYVPEKHWHKRARRTRLQLFRLLNLYCLQQEEAAHEVAIGAVPGVNRREAIAYYLGSEQFILNYFSRKRKEVTAWLGGAADEKLARLEEVRAAILSDYRRNKHRTGELLDETSTEAVGAVSGLSA